MSPGLPSSLPILSPKMISCSIISINVFYTPATSNSYLQPRTLLWAPTSNKALYACIANTHLKTTHPKSNFWLFNPPTTPTQICSSDEFTCLSKWTLHNNSNWYFWNRSNYFTFGRAMAFCQPILPLRKLVSVSAVRVERHWKCFLLHF